MIRKFRCLALFSVALAAMPSAFAVSGKTMYHYVAYEAAFWPKSVPANAEQYPKVELDSLANVPFDTLVFAPVFGFGSMAAILQSATYPKHQPQADSKWMSRWRNAMPELAKAGVDPIAETSKWCRKNKREAVVALPVNILNTHSGRPTPEHPNNSWQCYLWPEFKTANKDCLISPEGKGLGFGNPNCVDYAQAKVRDKFTAIAAEIAGKYDIDGIMVDFSMVPTLFRSVAAGGVAEPKETALVTAMMTKINAACKGAAGRLGHPVACAVRVPDSISYCKDIGIDLQGWLDAKLLDYVVIGGNFQLNRWNVTGDVVRKAGVPFYVSLTHSGIDVGNDSGYPNDDERAPRHSRNTCSARIADALLCGATGCMYTMGMHWEHALSKGAVVPFDAKKIRTADKRYFISYANDRIAGATLKEWGKHRTIPSLLSFAPIDLAKGVSKQTIEVWDDFAALKADGIVPKVTLITEVSIPSGVDTTVTFNGKPVKPFKKRAGTQLYDIAPNMVKKGANEVTVKATGKNKRGQTAKFGNVVVEVAFPKAGGEK